MASALTHSFAAVALTKTLSHRKRDWRFWTLAVASSILPDADVVGFAFGISMAICSDTGDFHIPCFSPHCGACWWCRANTGGS